MEKIVLYSTGCPQCNVLKKKLTQKNIVFEENTDENYMVSIGITRVPVLEVDGKRMELKEANEWINARNV